MLFPTSDFWVWPGAGLPTTGSPPPVAVDCMSRWIPVSYGVDAFRSVLIGFPKGYPELLPFEIEMVVVVLFGILSPLLGYLYYVHSEKKARIQGTLSEY
jgi:hypothetical protein